nr:DinB family protein [Nakamurella endophytica]
MNALDPVAPPPDDKDWTWVVRDRCPACGFDAAVVAPTALPAALLAAADRWVAVLSRPDVRRRPDPQVWSPLEYAAHVRDVFVLFAARAQSMLDQDDPGFANWDQDAAAVDGRYWQRDPGTLAGDLRAAAATAAAVYAAVPDSGWDRPGHRSNGSVFTVATLGVYFLHDVVHHLHDVVG